MGRQLWRTCVLTVVLSLLVAGCSLFPSSGNATLDRQRQQAKAALDRWADAVEAAGGAQTFVPVGESYAQIGDWEAAVGDNNKRALLSGVIVAVGSLPADPPRDADVRWDDGTSSTVRTMSAEAALEAMRTAGDQQCDGCDPLRVSAARLTEATVQTSRGAARAPVWEFAIEGTQVKVTRIAVDPHSAVTVSPPPWDPGHPPVGIWISSASGAVGGRELTVSFTGAREGDDPCSASYTAEAVESDLAVVVIVIEHPAGGALLPGQGCDAVGYPRTAGVQLAAPLGDRAVLEVLQGLPVAVTLTP